MSQAIAIKQFAAGSCYSYVISSHAEALVIDPHISLLDEYKQYLSRKRLHLKYIIDTHTHADHFSLAAVLKKEYRVPIVMHEKAASSIADKRLKDNEELALGTCRFKALYSPGHTDDSISIYGEGAVFTGDVLLIGSVGRTDFQNGSPEAMFDTLQRLQALPDKTVVYPAHDYRGKRSSTIGREKADNPFLKGASSEAFARNARSKKLSKPFNIDNIVRVNQRGEAARLEMISPREAQASLAKDPQIKLLDVRSAQEYSEVHIPDSINIPIDMLSSKLNDLSRAGQKYIVFCRLGTRSPMAADMLLQSGIHSVKVMRGGITAWQKEKLPVIKGVGGVSLERQVRVIAGSFMLIGIIAAKFIHPAYIWISAWVACGLIYAGATDNCLMGMLLMKLPYNKKMYQAKTGGGTCSLSQ